MCALAGLLLSPYCFIAAQPLKAYFWGVSARIGWPLDSVHGVLIIKRVNESVETIKPLQRRHWVLA